MLCSWNSTIIIFQQKHFCALFLSSYRSLFYFMGRLCHFWNGANTLSDGCVYFVISCCWTSHIASATDCLCRVDVMLHVVHIRDNTRFHANAIVDRCPTENIIQHIRRDIAVLRLIQWVQRHLTYVFLACVNIFLICRFKDMETIHIVVTHTPATSVRAKQKEYSGLRKTDQKTLVLISLLVKMFVDVYGRTILKIPRKFQQNGERALPKLHLPVIQFSHCSVLATNYIYINSSV